MDQEVCDVTMETAFRYLGRVQDEVAAVLSLDRVICRSYDNILLRFLLSLCCARTSSHQNLSTFPHVTSHSRVLGYDVIGPAPLSPGAWLWIFKMFAKHAILARRHIGLPPGIADLLVDYY